MGRVRGIWRRWVSGKGGKAGSGEGSDRKRESRDRARRKSKKKEQEERARRKSKKKEINNGEKKTPLAETKSRLTLVLNARMRAVPPIPASLPTPKASEAASKSMAARLGMNRSNCERKEREREGRR